MNRDELDGRPAGRPPVKTESMHGTMLLTVDGLAGGAWIGVHSDGLVVCLLNRTVAGDLQPQQHQISRGMIVPRAVQAGKAKEVQARLQDLNLATVQPFTLMAADAHDTVIFSWNGRHLVQELNSAVRCSSGLGDARVDGARHSVWLEMTAQGMTPTVQDAWHRSRHGSDSAAWVLMSRPGARTVSRSLVEITPARIRLEDCQLDEQGAETSRHHLEITR